MANRRDQIRNIAATVLPASHRTNDTVTAFSMGMAQGLAVGSRSPFLAATVIGGLRMDDVDVVDQAFDARTEAIITLLLES